jgi:hypothetical protein
MGVLSAIEGSALCGPAFPQVVRDRQGRSYAFLATSFQAVQASQAKPTLPSGSSSISLLAIAEPGLLMAGDQARPGGGVPVQGGTTQCRHPEDVAATQRQPYLLQWAIPALTGAVLVVNARMASSPQNSPAGCSAASN